MARVELPESRLKARRRKRRTRVLAVFAALVFVLAAGFVGLVHIPGLYIADIQISGAQTLASSTVRDFVDARLKGNYGFVLPKRNILLYPKQEIMRDLMVSHPVLSSADVHLVDLHTIAVNLVERQPKALWCEGSQCYFMDENGVVYGEAPIFSEPIYLSYFGPAGTSTLPRQYLSPERFQSLSALVDAVADKFADERVAGISVDANNDATMSFASGFHLLFSLNDQGGDIFDRLMLAMKSDPLSAHPLADFEYLDLRFGDKLYYKLKSE